MTFMSEMDMALERMTNLAIQKNLAAQRDLAVSRQRIAEQNSSVSPLPINVGVLQKQLRFALAEYEEANNNTGSWIDLLHKPFDKIAEQHEGFKETYTAQQQGFSEIVLHSKVQAKMIEVMAGKLNLDEDKTNALAMTVEDHVLRELLKTIKTINAQDGDSPAVKTDPSFELLKTNIDHLVANFNAKVEEQEDSGT